MVSGRGTAVRRPAIFGLWLIVCSGPPPTAGDRDWRQGRKHAADNSVQHARSWQRVSGLHARTDALLSRQPDGDDKDESDSKAEEVIRTGKWVSSGADDEVSQVRSWDGYEDHEKSAAALDKEDDDFEQRLKKAQANKPLCAKTHVGLHDFRNYVSAGRIRHIRQDDKFVLTRDEKCQNVMDVEVSVVPLINHTNPFMSEVYLNIPPHLGGGVFYVCWERENVVQTRGLRSRCLARVVQPTNFYSIIGQYLNDTGVGIAASKGVLIWRAGRRSWIIPLIAFFFFASVLVFVSFLALAVIQYFRLGPEENMDPPEPISLGAPLFILGDSAIKMISVTFAIVAFVGVSIHFVVESCGGTYTMFIAIWTTVFGMLAIWRMAIMVAKDQLYNAALRRGKCLAMEIELTMWDALLGMSWFVLFVCIGYGMVRSDAGSLAYFELASPCLVLGVNTGKFLMKEIEHACSKCLIALDLLANDLRGGRGMGSNVMAAGATNLSSLVQMISSTARRASDVLPEAVSFRASNAPDPTKSVSLVESMKEDAEDWKISERAFCTCCRKGLDPLDDDFDLPPEEEWGRSFCFLDILWLGPYMYRSIKTKSNLALLPITFGLVSVMMWSALECATAILVSPELENLKSTDGLLLPAFRPRIKEYVLQYDRHVDQLTLFTEPSRENTRQVHLNLSGADRITSTDHHDSLTLIDLSKDAYPARVTITLEGYGDGHSRYDIQLVPVTHLPATAVLDGTHDGSPWQRCTPFGSGSVGTMRLVWPPDKYKPANLTLAVFDYAPAIPMNMTEADTIRNTLGMLSVYEPVNQTDAVLRERHCNRTCELLPRCVRSDLSLHGCYYAYGPDNAREECMKMHEFVLEEANGTVLDARPGRQSLKMFGKLCWQIKRKKGRLYSTPATGEAVSTTAEPECKEDEASQGGRIEFKNISLWHSPATKEEAKQDEDDFYVMANFQLIHKTSSGEETVQSSQAIEFVSGAPLPKDILTWVPALKKELVDSMVSPSDIRLTFPEFDPMELKSRVIKVIVAVPVDVMDLFDFEFYSGDCDLARPARGDLPCDLPDWRQLSVCETGGVRGPLPSRAVVWQLPTFEPQGHILSVKRGPINRERGLKDQVDTRRHLKILMQTADREEPAQWCIRKNCAVDFSGIPHATTRRWLVAKVFNEAAQHCTDVTLTYTMQDDIPSSVRAFHFNLTQFVNFGIWMHNGHAAVIRLLEAVARNKKGIGGRVFRELRVQSDRSMVKIPEDRNLPHESVALLPLYYHELNYTRLPVEMTWDEIFQGVESQEKLIELLCNQTLATNDASMLMYRAASLHGIDARLAVNAVRRCANFWPHVKFRTNTEGTSGVVAALKYGSRFAFSELISDKDFLPYEIVSAARKKGLPSHVVTRSWADFAIKYGRDFAFTDLQTKNMSLMHINLAYMSLSGDVLKYLLNGKAFDATEYLDLSHNEIPQAGFNILSEKLSLGFFPNLRKFLLADVVTVSGCTTPSQFEFLRSRTMIEELDVSDNFLCDGDVVVLAALVKSATNLTVLNASYSDFGEDGARTLTDAFEKAAPRLTSLDLSTNALYKVAADELQLHMLTKLKHLYYNNNQLQANYAWFAGALAKMTELETLQIAANNITNEGMSAVLQPLKKSKTLRSLNLRNNPIGGEEITKEIATFLHGLDSLQELDLSWMQLGGAVLDVANNGGLKELRVLTLQSSGVGDRALAAALPNLPHLEILHVDNNQLALDILASTTAWPASLQELTLSDCAVGKHTGAVQHLATIMGRLPHLHSLSLGNNSLGAASDTEWRAFVDELAKHGNLFALRLHNNYLGRQFAEILATFWVETEKPHLPRKRCHLHELDLSGNNLGKEGLEALLPLLGSDIGENLHTLSLVGNFLTLNGIEKLADGIESGNMLKNLRILRLKGSSDDSAISEDELAVLEDRIPWVLVD